MITPCYNSVQQKHSKHNFFIIEKGSFIEWSAATGIAKELNTFPISAKYIVYTQFMAASALPRNTVSIEKLMTATTFVKQKKQCPANKKDFFRTTTFGSQPFLMSYYFTKIFLHLSAILQYVIAALIN